MDNIIKYLSPDKALYESPDEVLYVEHVFAFFDIKIDVLVAKSDGKGNITLSFATPNLYYQQNRKKSYCLYEIKCGITNANDIYGQRLDARWYGYEDGDRTSKFKLENKSYRTRSVGIDWDRVNSISGKTFYVKDLIKDKGFVWDKARKKWVKG